MKKTCLLLLESGSKMKTVSILQLGDWNFAVETH